MRQIKPSDPDSAVELTAGIVVQDDDKYFIKVEEHFNRRRGGPIRLLSASDWALIEAWKESRVPLRAVLQGIDALGADRQAATQISNGKQPCILRAGRASRC